MDSPELLVVVADASDVVVTINADGTRQCPECEVGVMTLDDHEWVCAACDYGEGEDDLRKVLQCPLCRVVDVSVREVDRAERWNTAEPEIEGEDLHLAYATGQSEFEHHHYECAACDKHVSLPAGLTERESWN